MATLVASHAAAPPSRRRTVIRATLSISLVLLVFVGALPRIASYNDAWDRLRHVTGGDGVLLAAVAVWNLATYAFLQMAALPGITFWRAMSATQMSTAVANTVPAGGAVGVGVTASLYRSWGYPANDVTRSIAVSGAWNSFVKLASPPAAVIVMALVGHDHPPVAVGVLSLVALALVIAAWVLALRDGPHARRVVHRVETIASRVATRVGYHGADTWDGAIERFQSNSQDLVMRRWPALTATAVVSHLGLFAVFAATMFSLGVTHVSLLEAFVVFAVVRVALIFPITPGGAGLAELGFAGMLVAAGADRAAAVAAVLVFRALTWVLPIPLGGLAYVQLLWSRRRR